MNARGGTRLVVAAIVTASLVAAASSSDKFYTAAASGTSTTRASSMTSASSTTARSTPPSHRASFAPAPCPNPIVAGVPRLDLGPEFECGYLTVPENRSKDNGRTIRIAVARAKASSPNPKPDPIVYLTGGPGGSGLAVAGPLVRAGWNADRDAIFLDQRGTLKSDPLLACPEVDAFLIDQLELSPMQPSTADRDAAATRACHDRLVAAGIDLAAFNTTENAADVADLRVALGIPEWNVYGVSYGTDLALQMVRDHPEGIRSLVLDSLVPPQLNLFEGFWPNAAAGYRALFAACAAQPACHGAFPNLEAEFVALVNELAAEPRTVPYTNPSTGQTVNTVFDGYTLANLVVVASLVRGAIAKVPALIHDLAVGDGTLAAAAYVATAPPPGLTGYGLTYGVFCSEQTPFTTLKRVVAKAQRVLPDFPESVLSLVPQIPRVFEDCANWSVPKADQHTRKPARVDIPVLLLEGSLDAVAPVNWAEAAQKTLPNSTLLVFPGAGHDVIAWQHVCAIAIMRNFLNQPDEFDDSCLQTVEVPPFDTE